MRRKKFTHGITFFVTAEMYQAIKKDTDELQISTSDLMRRLNQDYLYGIHSIADPGSRKGRLTKKVMRRLNNMEENNDKEGIAAVPSPTGGNQIEVKHTPVYDINRLKDELTLDDIGKSLRELNISPSMFFNVILEKLLKDHVKRHQLKKWFEKEIIDRAREETQNGQSKI